MQPLTETRQDDAAPDAPPTPTSNNTKQVFLLVFVAFALGMVSALSQVVFGHKVKAFVEQTELRLQELEAQTIRSKTETETQSK